MSGKERIDWAGFRMNPTDRSVVEKGSEREVVFNLHQTFQNYVEGCDWARSPAEAIAAFPLSNADPLEERYSRPACKDDQFMFSSVYHMAMIFKAYEKLGDILQHVTLPADFYHGLINHARTLQVPHGRDVSLPALLRAFERNPLLSKEEIYGLYKHAIDVQERLLTKEQKKRGLLNPNPSDQLRLQQAKSQQIQLGEFKKNPLYRSKVERAAASPAPATPSQMLKEMDKHVRARDKAEFDAIFGRPSILTFKIGAEKATFNVDPVLTDSSEPLPPSS